jgi:hypothetical protein
LWIQLPGVAQQYQLVCVGFYNLENLFDTLDTPGVRDQEYTPTGDKLWTAERYHDKLHNLAFVIADMGSELTQDGPAILGVAEIENRQVLEDLVREPLIASRQYQIVHYDSPDRRGVDVGLLYQPRYFTVIGSQSVNPGIINMDGKPVITRDILHVHGELQGQELHILVNHWPSRRGGEKATRSLRNQAAAVNRAIADSILQSSPEAGILIMGDFNDNPINESIRKELRSRDKSDRVKPGEFYNPFHAYYKKGLGTLAWRDAWSLFDQILISHTLLDKRPDRFYYYKSAVVNRPYLVQPMGHYRGYPYRTFDFDEYISGYSDHFPVVSYLVRPLQN